VESFTDSMLVDDGTNTADEDGRPHAIFAGAFPARMKITSSKIKTQSQLMFFIGGPPTLGEPKMADLLPVLAPTSHNRALEVPGRA